MRFPVAPLKHLASLPITNGVGEAAEFDEPSWPRYVRTTDISGPRSLKSETFKSLPRDVARRAPLDPGDIVMTAAGATIGKSMLYSERREACYAGYLVRFRSRPGVDARFVAYWMESRHYWDQIAVGKVVSTIENFSAGKYQNLTCPAPEPPEQRAIADFLDTETARIDALVTKKRRMIDLLRERRWRVLEELATGRPESRSRTRLKRLASFFTDGDWIESPYMTSSGIRLIQTGNIGRGAFREQGDRYISEQTFRELGCTEVLPGDVLISRLANTVGQACLAPDLGCRMVTSVDVVICRPGSNVDPKYLVRYLSSDRHLSLAQLEARGTTMQRLARSQVGELPVPLPPLDLQHQAVADADREVAPLTHAVDRLRRQIDLLHEHRQALITAAVTGELEVPGVAA